MFLYSFELEGGIYTSRFFIHAREGEQKQAFNKKEQPVVWTNSITRQAILKFPDWIDFFQQGDNKIQEDGIVSKNHIKYDIWL